MTNYLYPAIISTSSKHRGNNPVGGSDESFFNDSFQFERKVRLKQIPSMSLIYGQKL